MARSKKVSKKTNRRSGKVQLKTGKVRNVKWKKKTGGNWFKFEKKGQILEGTLVDRKIVKGQFGKQTVMGIKVNDDTVYNVSGAVLKSALEDVKLGTPVKIEFTGEGGKGRNKYKTFDVYTA